MSAKVEKEMTFMNHLEELRWHLVRAVVAILVVTIAVFLNKQFVFENIVLAPKHLDFITYKLACWLSHASGMGDTACIKVIPFTVTNIETVFKSLGIALDQATQIDPRRKGSVPSTKGIID